MAKFIQHSFFIIRFRYCYQVLSFFRKCIFKTMGMKIGYGTSIPSLFITWPHQVSVGNNCQLEHGIYLKYDGIYSSGPSILISDNVFIGSGCEFNCNHGIKIGKYSNIASGCRFIDHDHGIKPDIRIGDQPSVSMPIVLEDDVWLGCNVVVLKGVQIGQGAVVGAGAVVTKSIPSNEIWAGIPAKKIGTR